MASSDEDEKYASDDSVAELDDKEIDQELNLPVELRDLPAEEKRRLLRFKKRVSEVVYEEDLLQRVDSLSKARDLERLKNMAGIPTAPAPAPVPSKPARVVAAKKLPPIKKTAPTKKLALSDDDLSEDDDDDLFDSEEEDAIMAKTTTTNRAGAEDKAIVDSDESEDELDGDSDYDEPSNTRKRKAPTRSGTKQLGRRARKTKSALQMMSDDEFDDDLSDDDDESDASDDARADYDLAGIKNKSRAESAEARAPGTRGAFGRKAAGEGFYSFADIKKKIVDEKRAILNTRDDDDDPIELRDVLSIQMRRNTLLDMVNEPYFDKFVTNAFVKLYVGNHPRRGTPVYRMCRILQVIRDTPYKLSGSVRVEGSVSETNIRLKLSAGSETSDRVRVDKLSNHSITAEEVSTYCRSLLAKDQPLPTKRDIRTIRHNQHTLKSHTYSHEQIQDMVKARVGLNIALTTDYTLAMENLQMMRNEARENADYDKLAELEKEIERFEAENERQKQRASRAYSRQLQVNRRERENNIRRDMAAGMRKRQEDREAAAKGVVPGAVADPFIRRETRPKILWNTSQKLQEIMESKSSEKSSDATAAKSTGAKDANTATATQPIQKNVQPKMSGIISIDQINKRVMQRLGVDFRKIATMSKGERICRTLPGIDSSERNALRVPHITLKEHLSTIQLIE